MVFDGDFLALHRVEQDALLAPQLSRVSCGSNSKGVNGLGTKQATETVTLTPRPLGRSGQAVEHVDHLLREADDARHVLVRLGGEPHHEVELHIAVAPLEGGAAGAQHLLLGDVLVDDVPQPLGPGLGREGEGGFAHRRDPLDQLPGEVVHPERRQRDVDRVRSVQESMSFRSGSSSE